MFDSNMEADADMAMGLTKWIMFQPMHGVGRKSLNFITPKVRLLIQEHFEGARQRMGRDKKVWFQRKIWDTHMKERGGEQSASVEF